MEQKNVNTNNESFLKKMDIFEIPITFSYKNKYLYDTNFGGFLTIVNFIIIFSYSVSNLKDLFKGNHYSLISNEKEDYKYILNFSNVPFAFKLVNSRGEDLIYNKSIYDYKIITTESYYIEDSNGKANKYLEENIEFDYCEKFVRINKLYDYFNISNLFCIKPGQNLTMYGKFGDITGGFKGFRIYINKCNKKIENNTCESMEIMNEKLANIKLTFYYLGYKINHYLSNKNIIEHKIYSATNSLSINFMKKFFYRFQKGSYYLYNNLFLNTKESLHFYVSDGYEFDFELDSRNSLAKSDDSIGYFAFNTNGKIIEYTKSLNNLWDIIAKIGGVFNIVLSISKIINSFIAKRVFLLDINERLINKYSPTIFNKIEINENIKSIHKNSKEEMFPKKEFSRNDNSSIGINIKKNGKILELNLKDNLNNEINSNNNKANIDNISFFSKQKKTKINLYNKIKSTNKLSRFFFLYMPISFIEKNTKNGILCQIRTKFQ